MRKNALHYQMYKYSHEYSNTTSHKHEHNTRSNTHTTHSKQINTHIYTCDTYVHLNTLTLVYIHIKHTYVWVSTHMYTLKTHM